MTDRLLRIALAPLLLAQALVVSKTATSLPEAEGPRSGHCGDGPPLRLTIIGDSSAAGVGAQQQSEALSGQLVQRLAPHYNVDWSLYARTGATTRSVLNEWPNELGHIDVAVVVLGVNDITRQVPLRLLLAQRKRLYTRLKQNHGVARILVAGLPPMGQFPLLPNPLRAILGLQAQRYDCALSQQAVSMGIEYLPFTLPLTADVMASDGFHPGSHGYKLYAQAVFQKIQG